MESAEKTQAQAELLKNRIAKNSKALRKWARKNSVTCFRLYDRDIPEIPLAIDLYEFLPDDVQTPQEAQEFVASQAAAESENQPGAASRRLERTWLKVFLYERPYEKPEEEERAWLDAMTNALADCLGIDKGRIAAKTRLHEKGGSQYAQDRKAPQNQNSSQDHKAGGGAFLAYNESRSQAQEARGRVLENGSIFYVDLESYLDTGLFLDMRPARAMIKEKCMARSKAGLKTRVLNLFCYTSSFSVAAASGGAGFVQSVDLSNTYLNWSKKNFSLNGLDPEKYEWTKGDVIAFLDQTAARRDDSSALYDIIILDPPTFSNSKSAANDLDINRDWAKLCAACLRLLDKDGDLYFSTNSQRFKFDSALLPNASPQDITEQTIDPDFKTKKSHKMWLLQNQL
ncbi:MAG: class I SAM-dependent methyltransferase [Treponema sp.]|nr:class I SAM-dependent methyltransferase [Treponema sp.]